MNIFESKFLTVKMKSSFISTKEFANFGVNARVKLTKKIDVSRGWDIPRDWDLAQFSIPDIELIVFNLGPWPVRAFCNLFSYFSFVIFVEKYGSIVISGGFDFSSDSMLGL